MKKLINWLKNNFPHFEDFFALIIAMSVDFVFNFVFFSFVSADDLTRYGFTSIVFLMVFFKVRSLSKAFKRGKKISAVWLMFAIVTCYCGASFALIDIDYQSKNTDTKESLIEKAKNDHQLIDYDKDIAEKKAIEIDASSQYRQATQRATMDQLYPIWTKATANVEQAQLIRSKYYEEITTPGKMKVSVKDAFSIIPRMVIDSFTKPNEYYNLVMVIIFGMMFFGVELAIRQAIQETSSIKPEVKKEETEEKPLEQSATKILEKQNARIGKPRGPYMKHRNDVKIDNADHAKLHEEIERFVRIGWYNIRNNKESNKIISKKLHNDVCIKKGIPFNESLYDGIFQASINSKCHSKSGEIIERDYSLAVENIFNELTKEKEIVNV